MTLTAAGNFDLTAARCRHCGLPIGGEVNSAGAFCCPGCAAAYEMIETLGLGRYYRSRTMDTSARPLRPEEVGEHPGLDRFVTTDGSGVFSLNLMVEGVQCGACVWLIESVLAKQPGVIEGRVNMTTRRLKLRWRGTQGDATRLVAQIEGLGYRLVPFDPSCLRAADDRTGARLVRSLAIAGFAAGNIMLLSIGIWAGSDEIGTATRDLLHWISALIALPAIAYAGRPFFASAWGVLRHGRTNMDVPITIGVLLVTVMSLVETIESGPHAYFDSAVTLLFFLLIGRTLDHVARRRARVAAEQLIALRATSVTIVAPDGSTRICAAEVVEPGWRMQVASGERIGVDGVVIEGASMLDQSLITGESVPVSVAVGASVFAGTLNLGAPLLVVATATGASTVLAECVRLIEAAEARRGRFVLFADRIARRYAPVVHLTALATGLGWHFALGAPWSVALLNAAAVLIITCPCALALAVPAVQVISTGRLFRAGILLKSPTALERLATVDTVVFDKTGTLSEPELALSDVAAIDPSALDLASMLAAASRHPLARALLRAHRSSMVASGEVEEIPGRGVLWRSPDGLRRLGSAEFCGASGASSATGPELWLAGDGLSPTRFRFAEQPRADTGSVVDQLRRHGLTVRIVSGDRYDAVAKFADKVGIGRWLAECSPLDKVAALEGMSDEGHRVLMVGDGLNDGPALATALVSMSPSTAQDISQNAADIVFQGNLLAPVAQTILIARHARRLIRQNVAFSIAYNLMFVPLAIAGLVTPWLAAAAMSSSSVIVLANSFRRPGK